VRTGRPRDPACSGRATFAHDQTVEFAIRPIAVGPPAFLCPPTPEPAATGSHPAPSTGVGLSTAGAAGLDRFDARDTGAPGIGPLIAVVLLGALLRLVGLGGKSFWLDEAFSVTLARAPWHAFAFELRTREANMALYYALLRPWLLLGRDEATVRLLSALAAIVTIPIVYAIGLHLVGRRAAVVAALLVALDPLHLFASQDARGYSLAVLLVSCSMLAFVRLVGGAVDGAAMEAHDTPAPPRQAAWWWTAYTVTSALALYAHFYAGFVLLAQWISLVERPIGRLWRPLLTSGMLVALLAVPLGLFLLGGPHGNIDWIGGALRTGLPRLARSIFTPTALIGAASYAVLYAGITCAGIRAVRKARSPRERWALLLLLLWVLTPVAIPLLVSITVKPILEPRYLVVCIPGVALVAAALVDRIGDARRRRAVMGAIIAVEAFGAWSYLARFHKEDWRDATAFVLADARPGDVVLFYAPYVRRPFDYYVDRARAGHPERDPRILYPSAAYANFTFGEPDAVTLAGAIDRARASAPRTWVVLSHTASDTACIRSLDAALRLTFDDVHTRSFPAIEVRLYGRGSGPTSARDARPPPAAGTTDEVTARCPQV
jgi:mannosyltransferase